MLYYDYQNAQAATARHEMVGSRGFEHTPMHGDVTTWADTDYVVCRVTQRSTSGGVLCLVVMLSKDGAQHKQT